MKFKDFTFKMKMKTVIIGPWLLIGALLKTLYHGIRFNNWE
jgi:hypothetical protein